MIVTIKKWKCGNRMSGPKFTPDVTVRKLIEYTSNLNERPALETSSRCINLEPYANMTVVQVVNKEGIEPPYWIETINGEVLVRVE